MNATGEFIAPGQFVNAKGEIEGDPPDSSTLSLWASGLCSPFVTWGERLEELLRAKATGNDEAEQGAINKAGELFAPIRGDAPAWEELRRLRLPYKGREVPSEVAFLTLGVDVQLNRLVFVIRGWSARQESWLIDYGELIGDTDAQPVWNDLAELIEAPIGGRKISRCFVDSGFRPGKKNAVPVHVVYEFARRFAGMVWATKGYDHRDQPLSVKRIDVDARGGRAKYGLDLIRLDADFHKSWVHRRLAWPEGEPGAFHVYEDVPDAYLKQLVSESRVVSGSGAVSWVLRGKDNHSLDCEALAFAAASMLGIARLSDEHASRMAAAASSPRKPVPRPTRKVVRSSFMA